MPLPTGRTALLAIVVGLGLLQGCADDGAPADDAAPRPGIRTYVALGDSYTAAPLIGDTADATCARSANNYPHLLAEQAGLELTDVSCSAATTAAVEGPQQVGTQSVPPQLDGVVPDTDLVTVRLGINDFGLSVRAFIHCVQLAAKDPDGAPCTAADRAAGGNDVATLTRRIGERLAGVVDAVRDRSPDARVVLVGYPTIFPADAGCAALGLADGDVAYAHQLVAGVNTVVESVAKDAGAAFVNVAATTRDHHICAEEPWIAGRTVEPGRRGFAWHPYAEEQERVAALLLEEVR